ncbi:MAG TPA: helix-turn-helix domain-containing protein [Candidatus Binatia bacterium]|nr:helix-turn-helix domain-containing protein [Candidatus Binatia bacterium]
MSDQPAIDLAALLPSIEAIDALPAEQLPRFVAQLGALALRAASRMAAPSILSVTGDRMLTVEEAAARIGMSKDWLYRHKAKLPFARRIGRKVLFDEAGLTRWLTTRTR